MSRWARWTTGGIGLCVAVIGFAATWRVLSPGADFATARLDGWMFAGPALVTFGLLLGWAAAAAGGTGAALAGRGPALLLQLGAAFLALPALVWVWARASGGSAAAYAWTFSAFALGVPGIALALTGAALWAWRRLPRRHE